MRIDQPSQNSQCLMLAKHSSNTVVACLGLGLQQVIKMSQNTCALINCSIILYFAYTAKQLHAGGMILISKTAEPPSIRFFPYLYGFLSSNTVIRN